MIKNAISDSSRVETQSLVYLNQPTVYTHDGGLPVTLRLRGQQSDIEAAVDHWCIEVERSAWHGICRSQKECVVEGTLS